MRATLTEQDLGQLLGTAAASFAVPEDGPAAVREAAGAAQVVPLHRRRRVQVPAAAAVLVAAVAAVALLGGGDPDPGLRTQVASPVAASGGSTSSGIVAGEQSAPLPAALDTTARTAAPAAAAPPAAPVAAPVPGDGARVVKTGAIALVVDDGRVTPVLTEVQALATGAGGLVASARTEELGETPSGTVVLRVPVARFEDVVQRVRSLRAEVRSATTSGRDVTAEYADLEAQLRTLTAARERFLAILADARTIGDVLAVQQRVDDVTGRIDRLEGERRVLAAQSDLATLEVSVTEADDPVVSARRPDDGLSKAFSDAWDGFTSGVEALIRGSGRAVLVLLCAAAAWVVARLAWRASRRRLV